MVACKSIQKRCQVCKHSAVDYSQPPCIKCARVALSGKFNAREDNFELAHNTDTIIYEDYDSIHVQEKSR